MVVVGGGSGLIKREGWIIFMNDLRRASLNAAGAPW